jgi:adenylate cyclase
LSYINRDLPELKQTYPPAKKEIVEMSRFKLFYLRNGMLLANLLANLVAVAFVQTLFLKAEAPVDESIWENPFLYLFDLMFTPVAFLFVMAMTLIYERPIRQYLTTMMEQSSIAGDLKMKARRRLLNEPFVLIALDLSMWLLAAILYPIIFWAVDAGAYVIQRSLYINFSTSLITVTVAFFVLEYVLQKRLAPHFFPEGRLSQVPKTLRIRIRTRLVALLFACNLIPLFSVLYIVQRITTSQYDTADTIVQLRSAIFTNVFVFMGVGVCLTLLMSRNLTLPFDEILKTLRGVRNGLFDKKVRVTSNDEIGYTGDVINEMTKGLQEREMIKDAFGKYVAKEVRDEVLSGRIPLDGEKKEVTILFADLRNFTPLTETSDPKLVVRIMNDYFKEMSEAIQNQGGLVLQFIGDEIYAVFGAPISRPDHPERAFRAGLEMSRRLTELNKEFAGKGLPSLKHGIGIHTGEALAANIGSPDRLSYLLVGDTVNLASRLQSLTKEIHTEMIVSSATHARLSKTELENIQLRELPPAKVKGRTLPVEIFALA